MFLEVSKNFHFISFCVKKNTPIKMIQLCCYCCWYGDAGAAVAADVVSP